MNGKTGPSPYNLGRVSPGTPFDYRFTGKFFGSQGTGHRSEGRPCDFTFVKK